MRDYRWTYPWCCGPSGWWCLFDSLLRCKVRRICDAHDLHIAGGSYQ